MKTWTSQNESNALLFARFICVRNSCFRWLNVRLGLLHAHKPLQSDYTLSFHVIRQNNRSYRRIFVGASEFAHACGISGYVLFHIFGNSAVGGSYDGTRNNYESRKQVVLSSISTPIYPALLFWSRCDCFHNKFAQGRGLASMTYHHFLLFFFFLSCLAAFQRRRVGMENTLVQWLESYSSHCNAGLVVTRRCGFC